MCILGASCTLAVGNGVLDASCTCQPCASTDAAGDAQCQAAYGANYLCLAGGGSNTCVPGNCRSTNGTAPSCSASGQICNANSCAPCTGTSDCTTAYGGGHVCANGACVSGNCVTSSDCDGLGGANAGQICGATNNCAACTSDDQCAADAYYTGAGKTLCDSNLHVCVAATCTGPGPSTCAGSHVCCGTTCLANTTFSSSAGQGKSCCQDTPDCAATGYPSCTQHACTKCPDVQENAATSTYDFYVDPVNGIDAGASGANQNGCRFKTLSYALTYAKVHPGTGPTTPARVLLMSDTASSEVYPLFVPANVSIVGAPAGATNPAVKVPAGVNGIYLTGSVSGLSKLIIDGVNGNVQSNQRYNRAIVVQGNAMTGVSIDHVTVQNAYSDAILVGGQNGNTSLAGALTIGSGVVVKGSGFVGAVQAVRSNGVLVAGAGALTVNGGGDQIAFNQNSQHGILVTQTGSIAVNASVDLSNPTASSFSGAPVVEIGNDHAGLYIAQTPTGAATGAAPWTTLPGNTVTGLVVLNTTNGNAIRIEGGSKLVLRDSVAYGNGGDGVDVTTAATAAGTAADRNWIGGIDLGSGSAGSNMLQVPGVAFGVVPASGQLPNAGAGICLDIQPVANNGQTLKALGNILVQSTNQEVACASAAANTPVVQRNTCRSVASTRTTIGIPTSVGVFGANNTNTIDVTNCKGQ
jgi:hypothetical protein